MIKFVLFLSIVIGEIFAPPAYCMEQDYEVEDVIEGEIKHPSVNLKKVAETQDFDSPSQQMKFKLGFEFQEISGLCPWALNNNNIQKKSLFCFEDKVDARRLWKVVIDTSDIEFVTEPFTHKERSQVATAIDTLGYAFDTLQSLLNSQGSITFQRWIDKMEEQKIGTSDNPYRFRFFGTYGLVRDALITQPSPKWKPRFTPQVTVQHSLTYTIPLYFGLFGFDNPYMFQFSESLPYRDVFLKAFSEAQKEANSEKIGTFVQGYQQKMNGLVFLHALTLVQMTPENDPDDQELIEETYNNFTLYSQIDAKMKFTLMSRRPFSSMFKDIHPQGSYQTYFESVMNFNNRFGKIPSLFYKTNYAEQFCDHFTGKPKSLLHLLPMFRKDFTSQNQETLTKLLAQGIVSTTMIRNFSEEVKVDSSYSVSTLFNKYYEMAIKTVDSPQKTFIINEDNGTIQNTPFSYDILSPPCFLSFDNSMGRFKEDLTEEERQYGEAIIEVRGIRDVQAWFLKKCKLDPALKGHFMTKPDTDLKKQSLCLFDFLKDFGTSQDVIEIFYLGMPYALNKY